MDFHLWAVLLTVMCRRLMLFSSLYWHAKFVNTGKEDSSLFCEPNRKSQIAGLVPSLNVDYIAIAHRMGDMVRKQKETHLVNRG